VGEEQLGTGRGRQEGEISDRRARGRRGREGKGRGVGEGSSRDGKKGEGLVGVGRKEV